MHDGIKAWHRLALMALLKRHPRQTASELSEQLAAYCQADGVAVSFWRGMDPVTTFGVLRKMESSGLVHKIGSKPDSRAGRESPQWDLCDPDAVLGDIPNPVFHVDDGMQETQVVVSQDHVLLNAFDELAGIMARHRREMDAFNDRLRERLGIDG